MDTFDVPVMSRSTHNSPNKCRFNNLFSLFLFFCAWGIANSCFANSPAPKLLTSISNGQKDIVGLDNVRQIIYHRPTNQLLAASADDNAVTSFKITSDYSLAVTSIVRSVDVDNLLEGAASISFDRSKQHLFVASFYSGSVIQFSLQPELIVQQIYSDRIPHSIVFSKDPAISAQEDGLKLLGAYGLATSWEKDLVYVVAHMSETLSVFKKINNNTELHSLLGSHTDPSLAEGAYLATSQSSQPYLAVAGGKYPRLSIYQVLPEGHLSLVQTIDSETQDNFDKPIALAFQGTTTHLFVAIQNRVLQYKLAKDGKFYHSQDLSNQLDSGLENTSTIAFNPEGDTLFLLSEQSNKVHLFSLDDSNTWKHNVSFSPELENGSPAFGPSSIAFLGDSGHFALALAQSDTVNIYKF